MTLVLTAQMRLDAAQAKGELAAAKSGIQGVTAATEAGARASRTAAGAAEAEAAAKRRNAQAARELTTANRQAAGATGNLVAQFNDIGMMLAAGQNPLQLAIQQGSQITQSFGNVGAAGAAKMLGDAFVQMLNPINLITFGVIAAGAATVQWLTGAAEDTQSFEDSVADLTGKADAYVKAIKIARMSTAELRGEFGDTSLEIRALLKDMAELEMRETQRAARQSSQDLQAQLGIFEGPEFGVGNQKNLADMFDLSVWSRDARKEINAVLLAFQDLDNAGTLDQQIAAAETLKARFLEAAMASGEISAAEDAVLAPLNEMILTLTRVRGEQAGLTEDVGRTRGEAVTLNDIAAKIAGTIASADGNRLVAAFGAAFPAANALLGIAQGIVATIGGAQFDYGSLGDDERGSQRDELRSAGELRSREAVAARMSALRSPPGGGEGGGGGAGAARDEADALQELIASLEAEIEALHVQDPIQQEMLKHREALAGATEAERQKVEELIATREREAALMEGAKARAQFFEEIGTNALDALINKGESFNDVLKNIIGSLLQAVAQAAIFGSGPFGSLFGDKSILSGLFGGGGGGGGGLGSLLGGGDLFGGLAEGGMVHGPGTGTSDSIPTMLSNGEYVVNAQATARNRHLLEAINSGGRVGYAEGGYVGADNRRMAARGQGGSLPATIYMDLRGSNGDQAIEAAARKGAAQMIAVYDREGVPVTLQRVSGDPKRRG